MMRRLNYPNDKKEIEHFLSGRKQNISSDETIRKVTEICNRVAKEGITAVLGYTREFDGVVLDKGKFIVTDDEIQSAYQSLDKDFIRALKEAIENVRVFHQRQRFRKKDWVKRKKGFILGEKYTPIGRVGIYVPGGRAPLFSSVLMLAIPARLARVPEIMMATPPQNDGKVDPHILAAAKLAGVSKIYKMGGAQAIAALAYGTEVNPPVDKIVGPGNIYVTTAKRLVSRFVGIDFEAGPSEIMIIAEGNSNPAFIAADLLSQAEHDPLASSIFITDSSDLVNKVEKEIYLQLKNLSHKNVIQKTLENESSAVILVDDIEVAADLVNCRAPEHLELFVEDKKKWLKKIKNAGAIFIGSYSPTALGDYWAGPNHVLPTNGTAKFSSPLSVDQFLKKSSVISYSREKLEKDSAEIIKLIEAEGLEAHLRAVEIRLQKKKKQ